MTTPAVASDETLEQFAAGDNDVGLTRRLVKGQLGKRQLQLARVAGRFTRSGDGSAVRSHVAEQYALLAAIQRRSPAIVADVLLDPDVGVLLSAGPPEQVDLGVIVASAAIRSGEQATISARLVGNELFLPTLGTATIARASDGAGHVILLVGPDSVKVMAGGVTVELPENLRHATDVWQPLSTVEAGERAKLRALVRGNGPLWMAFGRLHPIAEANAYRLAEPELTGMIADGWHVLEAHHPASADAIAQGLRAIVPAFSSDGANNGSGTLNGVFGAVLLGLPSQPLVIACNLVHEFQHAKLAALQDLVPLADSDCGHTYYAPWRPDPRPLPALLQGVYAHLGVALFWRTIKNETDSPLAEVEFARWRRDTWRACRSLKDDEHFTSAGRRFVDVMYRRLTDLCAEEIPAQAAEIAARIARDHELLWRLNNLELEASAAAHLAGTWLGGGDYRAAALPSDSVLRRREPLAIRERRISLIYEGLAANADALTDGSASPADASYIRGDYDSALAAYADRVVAQPDNSDAWAGVLLSGYELGECSDEALGTMSAIAPAVYMQAAGQSQVQPSPVELLRWLATCR